MVDISSQNNKINVTVSSSGNTANTNVTPDYAQYYSEKSKEWAISNKIVDNTDYSSKYYANESKKQADISTAKTTEVIESGNNAVSNIESARDNAIADIINRENVSVDNVNTAGATQITNVNSAGTTQINLAKEQVTLATNQANIATEQAIIATNKASEVVENGNEALGNIDTAKSGAITDITDLKNDSISSMETTKSEALTEIETLHSSSVTDITGLKNTSITDITNLKNTSVSNIATAKNNAITSITNQETISKNVLIDEGATQVGLVKQEGIARVEEILETGCIDVEYAEETSTLTFTGGGSVLLSDYYTKEETNELIPDITPLATKQELQEGLDTKQDKGNYALKSEIPTKTSQLINDNNFTSQNYISSMGENLVVNGTGLLRNNFNFTNFTFDPTDGVNSSGCFKYINSIRGSAFTTNNMPFDGNQSYTLSYYVKNSELTKTYDFLNFFDMDGYNINSSSVLFIENTLMELTQPLKKGDTVVYVNDASKIVTTLNRDYNKGFIFWNYKSSSGFDYGVETYSRWFYFNLYSYENIDTVTNTITLNSPWNGLNFEAGWKLSQSSSGATYLYGNSQYISTPGVWEHKTFTFTKDKYFKGASYIKVGWLVNYSDKENNEFKISNITLSSKQDIISDLETIRAGANKGATALQPGTLENVLTQYSKTVLTTEDDYNSLATKDANTLYLIEE